MKKLAVLLAAVGGLLSGCVAYDPAYSQYPAGPGYSSYPAYPASSGYYYGSDGRQYRRDRDGDGVANRYDRDRDGDGVPNRADRAPDNPRRY